MYLCVNHAMNSMKQKVAKKMTNQSTTFILHQM